MTRKIWNVVKGRVLSELSLVEDSIRECMRGMFENINVNDCKVEVEQVCLNLS